MACEPGFLRKQLAVAVKSIQWSYAIFWSPSIRQHGVLEWCDGYYNGDIKTRKMVQAEDVHVDIMGLHRSEQLRELYKSLLDGESEQRAKKPPASLSPEDLSDAEWYYLVCMSFFFNQGQGLPGRALADDRTIWLCNAQYAESSVFSRSLLAKSASIQTVVCFPYLGGVIELGVTEQVIFIKNHLFHKLFIYESTSYVSGHHMFRYHVSCFMRCPFKVSEDPSLLQHVKDFLLKFSKPICYKKSSSSAYKDDNGKEPMVAKSDNEIVEVLAMENVHGLTAAKFSRKAVNGIQRKNDEFGIDSLDRFSNGCERFHQMVDPLRLEGVEGGASCFQSLQFLDDDFSYGFQDSMNPSDCISEALANNPEKVSSKGTNDLSLKELQNSNRTKSVSLDPRTDEDLHYKRTIFTILGSSTQLARSPLLHSFSSRSSFMPWKKGMAEINTAPVQQKMLKNILFTVPLLSAGCSLNRLKDGERSILKQGNDDFCTKDVVHDKLRENEKFMALKSMLPSLNEINKVSILNDTIKYLKMLEARVQELETCMDSLYYEERFRRKYLDMVEQTSDNYDYDKIEGTLKPSTNKRKACEMDETDLKLKNDIPKDGLKLDVKVTMNEQEVLVNMHCPYREYILVDVMDTLNDLQLDAHSVQSSDHNGVFSLTLKSKFQGMVAASVGMVKLALLKIANKS
ncbi:transcription factor EGL1-like isoform X2 [Cucurbita maxima]|uniref:Transcription factor EGL1-like isoform X2 n=1 Tax=Cucurbita maxima TaxID=3661 RepID=A0A6J1L0D5_CUCMA|nr:transcription factor EGL1-like isoform X2 [Cucurbita maxima]